VRAVLHVAVAIVRRGSEILLVHQAAPGEQPFWALPGGVVEEGELVTEGLAREVLEETGLRIATPARMAFVQQIDNRRPEQMLDSPRFGSGYPVTVWTFEIEEWDGDLEPKDPEGLVFQAEWVSVSEANDRLDVVAWLSLTGSYLRDEVATGSLRLERWPS
jgi:8-oxo-dGTP diphosphatase